MNLDPQVVENLAEILRVMVCGGLGLMFSQWVFLPFLRWFHSLFD